MDMAVESNGIELVSMVAMEDEAEKRAHHNALERKRRDHIKDSFYCLRDAVPQLRGEKASRALILNKATDYIKCLKGKNMCHKKEIDDIKKQNDVLEQEIDKIIKLNNSLGKDRIELLGEEVLALDKATNPQSSPPTFTRITEKDKGPFIGKRNLDQMNIKSEGEEEDEEAGMEVEEKERKDTTVTTKITKPVVVRSENVVDNTKGKSPNGPTKQPAKINLAHSGGTILSGSGGTIQIPASALAKALPNGFKNVTAIYKQTGNNKPIRLQIISPNGQSKRFVATAAPRPVLKPSNSPHQQSKEDLKTSSPVKVATIAPSETKELPENKTDEAKEETKEEAKEESKEDEVKSGGLKPLDDPHQPRTPVNQPLYARHRPLHSSPHKDSRRVNSSTPGTTSSTAQDKNANVSEFDSYKTQKNYTGQPNNEFDPPNRGNTRISRLQRNSHVGWSNAAPSLGLPGRPDVLPRDPSAMATISESELAFLTRPTTNSGNSVKERPPGDGRNPSKIEHGNIPILYKGSLLSERDKEVDAECEPIEKKVLYSARAMDGSRPFACHICGKSFNMLSSLKVHEHIHVPVKKKPYPCDLCHRSFMTLRILSQHKESHYGRISTFHRQAALCKNKNKEQSSLGKKSKVSFATHLQGSKSASSGSNPHSPRTSITNIFHVRASSPNDAPGEKSYNTVTITPSKNNIGSQSSTSNKSSNQRALPTTKVRQGQVIVQARSGVTMYKARSKAESEETRNFGMKVFPLKRSVPCRDDLEKKAKVEPN